MAELADAYGSGPYVRKNMQVQVLLSAPKKECLSKSYEERDQKTHKVCLALFVIVSYYRSYVNSVSFTFRQYVLL